MERIVRLNVVRSFGPLPGFSKSTPSHTLYKLEIDVVYSMEHKDVTNDRGCRERRDEERNNINEREAHTAITPKQHRPLMCL